MWDDEIIDGLLGCPEASLPWAALGYRAGFGDGCEKVRTDIGAAGYVVAKAARETLKAPLFTELVERRKPSFTTCPAACHRCSRCLAADAWMARGGRPYLGVRAEAELAVVTA